MAYYVAAKSFNMGRDPETGRERNYQPGDYVPEADPQSRWCNPRLDPKPWVERGFLERKEGAPPAPQEPPPAAPAPKKRRAA